MPSIPPILTHGTMQIEGQVSWGSNATLLVILSHEDESEIAIYKPEKGERHLWDFPTMGLYKREYASYLISEALGWGVVPATIIRDGEYGVGSLQQYVQHNPEEHYFHIENDPSHVTQFQKITLFDQIINNADRKGGHVLIGEDDRLWCIDHGISFHEEYKLRTVIWTYRGQPIPAELLPAIEQLAVQLSAESPLTTTLATLLTEAENEALLGRVQAILADPVFPTPPDDSGRSFPWPPV